MIGNPAKDSEIRSAIELKCSACYGAMSVANALGGSQTADWRLARRYKLVDLIAEANRRGLDMTDWKTAVMQERLCDTAPFVKAGELLEKLQSHDAVLSEHGWLLDGVFIGTDVATAIESI